MGGDPESLSADEQDALVRELGLALLDVVPSDWTEIRFVASALVDITYPKLDVVRADGVEDWAHPPEQATRLLGDLRRGMYVPGRGTWYTATVVITPPGNHDVDFDYDAEPRFPFAVTPSSFALDLEYFPRDDEAIPTWLGAKLAEAADMELADDFL